MFLLHSTIFFWDLAILMILTITGSLALGCAVVARKKPKRSFSKFLLSVLSILSVVFVLLVVYASFIEPKTIVTSRGSIAHPFASDIKIVVASDFHVGPYKGRQFVQRVVKQINHHVPDLVLLPGDFVYAGGHLSHLAPLGDIRAPLGVYAVLGNHDTGQYKSILGTRYSGEGRGEEVADYLEQLGITVLRNEHELVTLSDGEIVVAGIDDLWTGHTDIEGALEGVDRKTFTILLSHNPSVIDEEHATSAHLIVSAHTHGGQIRLPGVGPLVTLPISIGQQYDQGIFGMNGDTTLVITRGVGETSSRARLFAWPEVLVLEIHSGT